MSSSSGSKNKSSSPGLRILWIPGRKKHNRKGVYNPTKQQPSQYQGWQQKKNEPWSLGGSKGQSKLINSDMSEGAAGEIGATAASSVLCSKLTLGAGATSTVAAVIDPNNPPTLIVNLPKEGEENPAASAAKDAESNEKTCDANNPNLNVSKEENKSPTPISNLSDDEHNQQINTSNDTNEKTSIISSDGKSTELLYNASTLAISDRRKNGAIRKNSYEDRDDVDSIEYDRTTDELDGASLNGNVKLKKNKTNNNKKKKKKSKSSDDDDDDYKDKDKDEKLVTCLYYTLVCCDCSIS
uniref:Putative h/aca ribonucleoprotein complex non-core subunit naf1 n=1 Tax=Corethrella appendiculata TaxID=1370023 RepID=U5EP84_9DIPT